jgi:Tfp pilus assembly protein FimT
MKRLFKNKRGSEVVQNLIVIAIMGALAITAIGAISNTLKTKNTSVLNSISTNLDSAQQEASKK